jgi:glycogen operon protein
MTDADWAVGYAKSLGVFLNGGAIPDPDVQGRPLVDDSFYLIFNGWEDQIDFTLPEARWAPSWDVVLATAKDGDSSAPALRRPAGGVTPVAGHRLLVLQSAPASEGPS